MNLVGGFQALGTLLAVGIMMLPAVTSRFWARDITAMIGGRGRQRRARPAMPACWSPITPTCRRARPSSWWPARSMRVSVLFGPVGGLLWLAAAAAASRSVMRIR